MRSLLILCLVLFSQFLLLACASIDKNDCAKSNWEEIGYKDGILGASSAKIFEYQKLCGSGAVSVNQQSLYEAGRIRGLTQYCAPKGAYQAGAEGREFQSVCEKTSEEELLRHHSAGRKVFLKKQELALVREEIEKRRQAQDDDKSVVGDVSRAYHLFSGTSPTESLDRRDEDLSDEIYRLESEAPPGYVSAESMDDSRFTARALLPLMGATFGTAGGFGMGHAIQGRYYDEGWKWTVIDTSLIATLAIAAHNCPNRGLSTSGSIETSAQTSSGCDLVLPIGVLSFVGARVWQSVDLWSYATRSFSPLNVLVLPKESGAQVNATWSW